MLSVSARIRMSFACILMRKRSGMDFWPPAAADLRGWRKVFTLDSRFFAYRLPSHNKTSL